jgi:hypothetical protein
MKKSLAALLLVVGMTLGSALTMVLNPVGAANALAGTSSTSSSHQNILQQALSTLVGNGTITQKQSDAVNQQVENLRKQHPHPGFAGMGRPGGMGGLAMLGRDGLTHLATLLKTTPQALMADLKAGKTIAQIAQANGVDVTTLIATLDNDAKTEIQKQVTAGHLTQDQATKIENGLATMITDLVNGTMPHFGFGFGRPGPGAGAGAATIPSLTPPAPPTTPTTAAPAPTTAAPSTTAPSTTTTATDASPSTTKG